MEVPYNLGPYFTDQPIQRLDHTKLKFLNPRKCWMVEKVINMMGNLSAQVFYFRYFLSLLYCVALGCIYLSKQYSRLAELTYLSFQDYSKIIFLAFVPHCCRLC